METCHFSTSQKVPSGSVSPQTYGHCYIVFWDAEGIVLIDYLEHGSTITGTYYADLIGKCRAALKEKRGGKLRRGVLFHQDNAPAHTSSQARTAIRNAGFELLHHPPYLPDLAPNDFYLFPKLKEYMKG